MVDVKDSVLRLERLERLEIELNALIAHSRNLRRETVQQREKCKRMRERCATLFGKLERNVQFSNDRYLAGITLDIRQHRGIWRVEDNGLLCSEHDERIQAIRAARKFAGHYRQATIREFDARGIVCWQEDVSA